MRKLYLYPIFFYCIYFTVIIITSSCQKNLTSSSNCGDKRAQYNIISSDGTCGQFATCPSSVDKDAPGNWCAYQAYDANNSLTGSIVYRDQTFSSSNCACGLTPNNPNTTNGSTLSEPYEINGCMETEAHKVNLNTDVYPSVCKNYFIDSDNGVNNPSLDQTSTGFSIISNRKIVLGFDISNFSTSKKYVIHIVDKNGKLINSQVLQNDNSFSNPNIRKWKLSGNNLTGTVVAYIYIDYPQVTQEDVKYNLKIGEYSTNSTSMDLVLAPPHEILVSNIQRTPDHFFSSSKREMNLTVYNNPTYDVNNKIVGNFTNLNDYLKETFTSGGNIKINNGIYHKTIPPSLFMDNQIGDAIFDANSFSFSSIEPMLLDLGYDLKYFQVNNGARSVNHDYESFVNTNIVIPIRGGSVYDFNGGSSITLNQQYDNSLMANYYLNTSSDYPIGIGGNTLIGPSGITNGVTYNQSQNINLFKPYIGGVSFIFLNQITRTIQKAGLSVNYDAYLYYVIAHELGHGWSNMMQDMSKASDSEGHSSFCTGVGSDNCFFQYFLTKDASGQPLNPFSVRIPDDSKRINSLANKPKYCEGHYQILLNHLFAH